MLGRHQQILEQLVALVFRHHDRDVDVEYGAPPLQHCATLETPPAAGYRSFILLEKNQTASTHESEQIKAYPDCHAWCAMQCGLCIVVFLIIHYIDNSSINYLM